MKRLKTYLQSYKGQGSVAIFLLLTLILGLTVDYSCKCNRVRNGVLRLHVIAQSDSDIDQEVKLKVRDAMLTQSQALFDGTVTAEDANNRLTPYLPRLEETANRVLKENGLSYQAKASLTYEYFEERAYGDITLPAGNYTALKVVLGEGKGKNWWCVMFPPLCLPAVEQCDGEAFDILTDNGEVVQPKDGYRIRFQIAEWVQRVLVKIGF